MTDDINGWGATYLHLRYERPGEAITWLRRVFGLQETVRLAGPDGQVVVARLQGPIGGVVMVAGLNDDRRRRQAANGRLTPIEYEMIMTPPATQAA